QLGRRAEKCVAVLDMRVEERERKARFDGFHPQADRAQLYGHWVQVDAEDAATDDLTEGVPVLGGRRRAVRLEARDVGCEPPSGGQKEVSGATRRIDDGEAEQRIDGVARIVRDAVGDDVLER